MKKRRFAVERKVWNAAARIARQEANMMAPPGIPTAINLAAGAGALRALAKRFAKMGR
jgi:hypothetical protein